MNNQLKEAVISVVIDFLNESKPVLSLKDLMAGTKDLVDKARSGSVSPASKTDIVSGAKNNPTGQKGPYKKMIKGKVLQMQSSKKPGVTAQQASMARRDDKAVERRIATRNARKGGYFSNPSRGED